MSFREKSAGLMALVLLLASALYAKAVLSASVASGALVAPNFPDLIGYTLLLVILSVLGHIVLAAVSPKEANAQVDERERAIAAKAGRISGALQSAGVVLSLLGYLWLQQAHVLFYCILATLVLAQLLNYGLTLVFNRMVWQA